MAVLRWRPDLERDRTRYEADRARDMFLSAEHGIDEVLKTARLDALLFPGGTGAALAAKPGYPTVIVLRPAGDSQAKSTSAVSIKVTQMCGLGV